MSSSRLDNLPSFGPFHLDLENEVLYRDKKEEVELRPITFAVLRCLYNHRNKLISHRELTDCAWGRGTAVSEKNRTQTINELRAAFKDERERIETRHARGYIFHVEETPRPRKILQQLPDPLKLRINELLLKPKIKRALKQVLTAESYPTLMTLSLESVLNPIWRFIPPEKGGQLSKTFSPFGEFPPRIMHLDIFLLRANDKMGRPRLLNYFSGKPVTGWQAFMLPFRHRRPGEKEPTRQRENAKDIAEFLGLKTQDVLTEKLGDQFVVSVKPDPGYSELVTYIFEFCKVKFAVAPQWMRNVDCTLNLDTSVRKFRWLHPEEMEQQERSMLVDGDVIRGMHYFFGTTLPAVSVGFPAVID